MTDLEEVQTQAKVGVASKVRLHGHCFTGKYSLTRCCQLSVGLTNVVHFHQHFALVRFQCDVRAKGVQTLGLDSAILIKPKTSWDVLSKRLNASR